MPTLPVRGPGVRELALPLTVAAMPGWRRGRPLKRWRYVGVFTPELLLCVAEAFIAGLPRRWWAVALPDGRLIERTTARAAGVTVAPGRVSVRARGVAIELALDERPAVEVVSPTTGGGYIWTAKQACVPTRGTVRVAGQEHEIDAEAGFVDESAGYHDRHTRWCWSAGIGTAADGRAVGWNLVEGIHDDPAASERTVWIAGEPHHTGPVRFADRLDRIDFGDGGALDFAGWSERRENRNLFVVRSRYRQPFGSFSGHLPGGVALAHGHGVMEEHDVHW